MKVLTTLRAELARPAPDLLETAAAAREGGAAAKQRVVAAQCWAAFAAPAGITAVYDALAAGWLVLPPTDASTFTGVPEVPIPDALWQALEALLEDAEAGFDAGTITARVAALGGLTHGGFGELAERAASAHPGGNNAAAKPVPPLIDVQSLAETPAGSLGQTLYRMLVDNGYDAEVLDREVIGLAALSPALRYLNTRILQMHDVWHLVAGYETTALHEIAISGFQLAQFGHNYSAMFLATVGLMTLERSPDGFGVLAQTVFEAWHHGRQTPPLMAIAWEDCWREPLEELRKRQGIEPFAGSFPADLFEQLAA